MDFRVWLEMSSLRDKLQDIPQSPVHHKEGDAYTHTRMARYALDTAVQVLKEARMRKDSPFRNLNLDLSNREIALLKSSAWMHDIGKASATTLNIGGKQNPYSPELEKFGSWGKWQALGHEDPKHFIPNMRDLKDSPWNKIWNNSSTTDKKDMFSLVGNHMSIRGGQSGFDKNLFEKILDNDGQYKDDSQSKLLIILVLMDHIGRGVENPIASAWEVIDSLTTASKLHLRKLERMKGKGPASNNPIEFLKGLANKPIDVLTRAFQGKFGRTPTPEELNSI